MVTTKDQVNILDKWYKGVHCVQDDCTIFPCSHDLLILVQMAQKDIKKNAYDKLITLHARAQHDKIRTNWYIARTNTTERISGNEKRYQHLLDDLYKIAEDLKVE